MTFLSLKLHLSRIISKLQYLRGLHKASFTHFTFECYGFDLNKWKSFFMFYGSTKCLQRGYLMGFFNCQSLRQSWIPLNLCLHFASLEKGGWIKTVLLLSKYLSYNCTSFSQNDKSPSSQNVNFQNIHFQLEIPFHSPNVFTLIIFKFSSGIFRSMTLKRSIRNRRNARFLKIDVESV